MAGSTGPNDKPSGIGESEGVGMGLCMYACAILYNISYKEIKKCVLEAGKHVVATITERSLAETAIHNWAVVSGGCTNGEINV